ncbi:hypothetical protein ACFYKT_01875 [Cytobacillus sp. FJAT-53684]|uniref:Uncharacterized protein n=1 Tax=Cytobacillus mangrovibacter TaxID=3299024 RepID=A0ABW6JTA9_9BACI
MANLDKSNLKISVNGKELNGEKAREYAEKITKTVSESFSGLLSNNLGNLTSKTMNGNFSNMLKPFNNLNSLLKQSSSVNPGIQNMIPALSKMLPVFETSDDHKKLKLSLNGVSLLDIDLTDLTSNNSKEEE